MSISAATNSTVLATAPVPKKLHYGQAGPAELKGKEQLKLAIQIQEQNQRVAGTAWTNGTERLMQAFGIDENEARGLLAVATSDIREKNYGSDNASLKSTSVTFSSPDAAKALARDKMAQVEYGVQNYNILAKRWSTGDVLKSRQEYWQKAFDARLEYNGGDEKEAIKFAEKCLKESIESEGFGGDNYDLRLGLGGLEAGFGALPANLITENKDGTLSINRDALKGTTLGNLLNIGSDIGQSLDQVA